MTKRKLLKPTKLYEMAQVRLTSLEDARKSVAAALHNAPEGKIHIVNSNGRAYYRLRMDPDDRSGRYISIKDTRTIGTYLRKSYDQKALKYLDREIGAIHRLLEEASDIPEKIQDIYKDTPAVEKPLLNPIDVTDEAYTAAWLAMPFDQKEPPSDKSFKTENGEYVRSKSELNIANTLYKLGIPYRYEAALKLANGKVIHPDFTILDVKRRRVLYWEHRGMMDVRWYAQDAVQRLYDLQESGIYPGNQLILTEELDGHPLGTEEIHRTIAHYLAG